MAYEIKDEDKDAITEIELSEEESTAISTRLGNEFSDIVGDDLATKKSELEYVFKSQVFVQAKDDKQSFDDLKVSEEWKEKTDDDIWGEVERVRTVALDEETLGSLIDPKSKKKKKKEKSGSSGLKLSKQLGEAQDKLKFYDELFEADPLLKPYVISVKTGDRIQLLKMFQSNPTLSVNLETSDKKSIYRAHLEGLHVEHGDSVLPKDKVQERVDAWDDLEPEDKAAKLTVAKEYILAAQTKQLKELGTSYEGKLANKPRVSNEAVAQLFDDAFDSMRGKVHFGLKYTDKVIKELEKFIQKEFKTHDEKNVPIPENIILFAQVMRFKKETAQAFYGAGKTETAKSFESRKSRASRIGTSGGSPRGSSPKANWEARKRADKEAAKGSGTEGTGVSMSN